jgi:hypothetical protein
MGQRHWARSHRRRSHCNQPVDVSMTKGNFWGCIALQRRGELQVVPPPYKVKRSYASREIATLEIVSFPFGVKGGICFARNSDFEGRLATFDDYFMRDDLHGA